MTPELTALIERMQGFNENERFDGYPSMTCSDEGLIESALESEEYPDSDWVRFVAYQASVHCLTEEHYVNARRFYMQLIETIWDANMSEGNNPAYFIDEPE